MKAPLAAFLFSLGLNLTGHSILPTAFFVSSSEIADEVSATAANNKDGTTPFIPDENTYARIKATRSRRMAEQRERVRLFLEQNSDQHQHSAFSVSIIPHLLV